LALFLIPVERFANFANGSTRKLQAVRQEPLFKCASSSGETSRV
jgi:hypothetical protein